MTRTKKTAETVLVLRTCSANMTSYGGFKPVGRRRRSDQTMKLTKWTTPLYNSDGEKVSDEDGRILIQSNRYPYHGFMYELGEKDE